MNNMIPWSELKRRQANPEQGFITGIDMQSEEEKAKIAARKNRFGEIRAGDISIVCMDTTEGGGGQSSSSSSPGGGCCVDWY